MKPKYTTSKLRNPSIGASLVTAISICFTSSAFAVDNFWEGDISTDWNTAGNWSLNRVPVNPNGAPSGETFDDAVVNVQTPNIATITANVPTPRDFRVGQGAGANGRLDLISGSASTGGGNWAFVGRDGGTGVFNLANTAGTGGTLTGFAQGSGNFTCNASRLYIGGADQGPGGGNGTFNMHTSGTLTISVDLTIGASGGTGVMNVDSGTITTGGWNFVGKNENGTGANGTLNMSGGTLTNTGRTFIGTPTCTGTVVLSGGDYIHTNNEVFIVGGTVDDNDFLGTSGGTGHLTISNAASLLQSPGEFWVGNRGGTGDLTFSAGAINVGNWVAIGRNTGTGSVNMTGGTWTKTGAGSAFILGASGPGTMTHSGGTVDVQGGDTWIGENSTATYTLSGSGLFKATFFQVARNGSSVASALLQGGTLQVSQINGGGGNATVDFNGTQIVANLDQPTFISGLDTATVGAGGLKVDSAGRNLTVPQEISGSGPIIKSGAGSLTFTSPIPSFTGPSTVNAGKLAFTTGVTTVSGNVTVANTATLGVSQTSIDEQLTINSATFGSAGGATNLDINLGNIAGNTVLAPAKFNTVTLNGPVTINVTDSLPETGFIPLVEYGSKLGTGNFVLGTLPLGVVATLDTSVPNLVQLNVTSVKLPRWVGNINGLWDTTTQNWIDLVTGNPTTYANGTPPLFDDNATGTTDVILNTTVTPSLVTFDNFSFNYTLTGTGKISGTTGLVKTGSASLTLGTANDYTGVTTLQGGVTSIPSIANGGVASSIGASTASASNLVLAGGVLNYTGATTSTNRNFTINAANSGISTTNDLTMSGTVTMANPGNFTKAGPGKLTFNNPGALTFGLASGQGLRADGGTLEFIGSGTQTVAVSGDLWVGSVPNVSAALVLNGTSLTVPAFLALGRGNGDGAVSSLTATSSTIQTGSLSTGFDNNLATNNSDQNITLTNTTWTNTNVTFLGERQDATTNMVLAGNSVYTAGGRVQLALGANSVANLTIQDSASLIKTGEWLSVGTDNNGVGTLTVKNAGSITASGDFNIADVGTSQGTMTVQDTASVTSTGDFYIAKNVNTVATVNLNGGTLTARRVSGNNGTGDSTLNLNGGTLRAGSSAVAEWVTGIDNVVIQSGGAKIDTNGKSVQFAPAISEDSAGRTLTKLGTGTLFINGFGSYTGLTTVSAGTLAGIGNIAGPVTVSAGASVNPGITLGALFVESINFASTASLTIDLGVVDDTLVVANELNLGNSPALVLTGTPNLPVHVIASYTTRIGTFGSVTLPPGYTIDYNFEGNNQIALVQTPTPYTTWASSKGLTGSNNGPTQDPEFDGISNLLEFILGGNPLASDPSILPVQTLTPTDFVFTFSRADQSESETTQKFQYGSTLTNWTDVPIGAVSSPGVAITENGASPDTVVVTIPRTNAIGGKLFGRLNAVK